jgi:hypothetical protein
MALRQKQSLEFLKWLSERLQYSPEEQPKSLDELKNGVAILQLAHSLNPQCFDLFRVDFLASTKYHYEKNWKLLQEAFRELGIGRDFIIERLCEGERQRDLFLLASYLHSNYDKLQTRLTPSEAEVNEAPPELRARLLARREPYEPAKEREKAIRIRRERTKKGNAALGQFRLRVAGSVETMSNSESSQVSAFSSYSTKGMQRRVRFKSAVSSWVQELDPSVVGMAPPGGGWGTSPHNDSGQSADGSPMGPQHPRDSGRNTPTAIAAAAANGQVHSSLPVGTLNLNPSGVVSGLDVGLGAYRCGGQSFGSLPSFMTTTVTTASTTVLGAGGAYLVEPATPTPLPNPGGPTGTSPGMVCGGPGYFSCNPLTDFNFIRETMRMEVAEVEGLSNANFWTFDGWPIITAPAVVDIDGDRARASFTFKQVKQAAQNRSAAHMGGGYSSGENLAGTGSGPGPKSQLNRRLEFSPPSGVGTGAVSNSLPPVAINRFGKQASPAAAIVSPPVTKMGKDPASSSASSSTTTTGAPLPGAATTLPTAAELENPWSDFDALMGSDDDEDDEDEVGSG